MLVSSMVLLALWTAGMGQAVPKKGVRTGTCRKVSIEGEVRAGQGFERAFGGGLKVGLEPIPEGWAIRIVPATGPRGAHDYAELGTPPYRSLSPLVVSTGFGFRAQDAVGWNPRRFRFAANAGSFAALLDMYERYTSAKAPSAADEAELARRVAESPEGTLQILDARLIPGTADQVPAAGAVASHFGTTAHEIDQPADGKGSELGRLQWIRFRFMLDVPVGTKVDRGVMMVSAPCGGS